VNSLLLALLFILPQSPCPTGSCPHRFDDRREAPVRFKAIRDCRFVYERLDQPMSGYLKVDSAVQFCRVKETKVSLIGRTIKGEDLAKNEVGLMRFCLACDGLLSFQVLDQ
jgi:hypothetical protein